MTTYLIHSRDADTCENSHKRTDWKEVADRLIDVARSSPGAWVMIGTKPTNRIAREVVGDAKPSALLWLDVEAFARRVKPRVDGLDGGWEIWLRLRRSEKEIFEEDS